MPSNTMRTSADIQDMQPLVRSSTASVQMQAGSKEHSSFRRHWKWLLPLLAASVVVLFMRVSSINAGFAKAKSVMRRDCPKSCKSQFDLYQEKWGGDLSQTSTMLRRAEEEREKLVARLKVDYGEEYYPRFFLDENGESIGRTGFLGANQNSTVSRNRYIRKLKMKILSVQMAVKEESRAATGCDCSNARIGKRYLQGNNIGLSTDFSESPQNHVADHYARFVWANGGHSSAAGHGNLFSETYTAVMERAAKDVFAAVGIDLEGRNHAMGGMSSAPELALCNEAVYGIDADLITWNFGMTDGNWFWRNSLYGNRRGVHRNRPLLLDIDVGTDHGLNQRVRVLKELEDAGLASMYMSENYFYEDKSKGFIPDMQNMTQEQIDAVPEHLRYFKCGGSVEKGEPLCGEKKYTHDCTTHKAPWHPGWKANALGGNMLAMFMVDLLLDALKELNTKLVSDYEDMDNMLAKLKLDEDTDYERFFNSSVPGIETMKTFWNENITEDHTLMFRSPALCHTALLPAETRYRGILTEIESSSFENFDAGIMRTEANERNSTDRSSMQLVYDKREEHCGDGEDKIDFKDYFFTTHKSGVTSLTLPNKSEKEAYLSDGQEFHGLVLICFVKCDWGRCPDGNVATKEVNNATAQIATMWVNGIRVEELTDLSDCSLLRNERGYLWDANDRGEYEVTAQVHEPDNFMRISSVILI